MGLEQCQFRLIFFSLLLIGQTCLASQVVRLGIESSSSTVTSELGYQWQRYQQSQLHFDGLNLSRTSSKSDASSSSGQGSTLQTLDWTAGADFGFEKDLTFGFYGTSVRTEEAAYSQSGPGVWLSVKASLGELEKKNADSASSANEGEPFLPWIRLGVDFSQSKIQQDLDFTILSVRYQKTIEINSQKKGLRFALSPIEDWIIRAAGTRYEYDRSFEDLSAAAKSRLLSNRASNLVDTISGLLEQSASLSISKDLTPKYSLEVTADQSTTLLEKLKSNGSEISFTAFFEDAGITLETRLRSSRYEQSGDSSLATSSSGSVAMEIEF